MTAISAATRKAILARLRLGHTYERVAADVGVAPKTVGRVARRYKVIPRPRPKLSLESHQLLLELLRAGEQNKRDISRAVGCCEATTHYWSQRVERLAERVGRVT